MKKSISYYLADLSRLDSLPLTELTEWVDNQPYNQALHKLLDLRLQRQGTLTSDLRHENAAHHAIDLDLDKQRQAVSMDYVAKKNNASKLHTQEVDPVKNDTKRDTETASAEYASSDVEVTNDAASSNVEVETPFLPVSEVVSSLSFKEVAHDMASETLEDQVEEELLELVEDESGELTLVESSNEVTHEMASEILEDQVEEEVLEFSPDVKSELVPVSSDMEVEEMVNDSEIVEEIVKKSKKQKKQKGYRQKDVKKASAKKKKRKKSDTKNKIKKAKAPRIKKEIVKEVRYVYLEDRHEKDYRLHEYEGENDYIKWLMKSKSINKNKVGGKKKKDEKKKSSKEKDVLKSAEDSVKKRDVIISETLADIYAAQGHRKEAKKMYKQLSLIFPEKSSYFAGKIKKLKKK